MSVMAIYRQLVRAIPSGYHANDWSNVECLSVRQQSESVRSANGGFSPTKRSLLMMWRNTDVIDSPGSTCEMRRVVFRNDQTKQYEGHQFRDFVLQGFHHTLDVPRSVENMDV
jgi:hypothetical protein